MRQAVLEPDLLEVLAPYPDDPTSEAVIEPVDESHKDRFDAMMAELPGEVHRGVVECIVIGQMTRAETAAHLGISEGYVYRLWREARDVLKENHEVQVEEGEARSV